MLVKKNMGESKFIFSRGDYVAPLEIEEQVLVVTDPSKQNMALLVGGLFGDAKVIYEFSGKDEFGKAIDTVRYCIELREFMVKLLCKCRILEFSQEEAIDKKDKQGLEFFQTSLVLRDVRAFSIVAAVDLTNKEPHFINNWIWKTDVLPDGYRSQKEKGSQRFLVDYYGPQYATYSNDVTDVICMYMHRKKALSKGQLVECVRQEEKQAEYRYYITDISNVKSTMKKFKYNNSFSLTDNLNYFTNRVKGAGYAELDLSKVSPIEMVGHCLTTTFEFTPVVIVAS